MDLRKVNEIGNWDRFKVFKWELSAKEMISLYDRDKGFNPERTATSIFLNNYVRKRPETFVCNGIWMKQAKSLINVGDQVWAQKVQITLVRKGVDPITIEESGVADSQKSSRAIAFAKVKSKVDELAHELDDVMAIPDSEYFDAHSFLETELWEDFSKPRKTASKKRKKEEICPICQRSFCDKYYVEDHMLSVHEVSCPFPGCKELFKTRANLNNHFLQIHNLNIRGLSLAELLYISLAAQEEEKTPPSSPSSCHRDSSKHQNGTAKSAEKASLH